MDDRRWVVGGGSLRQERDYYARVFDAATVADLSTFQNSYTYEIEVQTCDVEGQRSFEFTYYTDYRVLDLRCGNYANGMDPSTRLEIQIPGTFPVGWKGELFTLAGGVPRQ